MHRWGYGSGSAVSFVFSCSVVSIDWASKNFPLFTFFYVLTTQKSSSLSHMVLLKVSIYCLEKSPSIRSHDGIVQDSVDGDKQTSGQDSSLFSSVIQYMGTQHLHISHFLWLQFLHLKNENSKITCFLSLFES